MPLPEPGVPDPTPREARVAPPRQPHLIAGEALWLVQSHGFGGIVRQGPYAVDFRRRA
jgi:hypothetical protein